MAPSTLESTLSPSQLLQEQRVLTMLAAGLTGASTVQEIGRQIVAAAEGLGCQGVLLGHIVRPGEIDVVAASGVTRSLVGGYKSLRIDLPLPFSRAARAGEPLWMRTPLEIAAESEFPLPFAALASLPLRGRQGVIGSLGIGFAEPRAFDGHERDYWLAVVALLQTALERTHLVAQAENAVRRLELVSRLGRELQLHMQSLPDLKAAITHRLGEAVGDYCTLRLVAEDGDSLRLESFAGKDPAHTERARHFFHALDARLSLFQEARELIGGRTLYMPEFPAGQQARLAEATGLSEEQCLRFRSLIAVPLVARGRGVGLLTLVRVETARAYTPDDVAMLEDIGTRVAVAIDNATLLAKAHQAVAVRDDFMWMASHELRTPLTSAYLQVEVLQRGIGMDRPLDMERLRRGLKVIHHSLERQNRLIANLLDATRIRSGALVLERKTGPLSAVVKKAVDSLEAQRAAAKVKVETIIEADPQGAWDAERLEQVIANLLVNAFKYGGGKDVTVRVNERDGWAVAEVADAGPGIPPDKRAGIFERFNRGGRSDSNGLGLGLFIAAEIARAHGGRIELTDAASGGAAFAMWLPLQ